MSEELTGVGDRCLHVGTGDSQPASRPTSLTQEREGERGRGYLWEERILQSGNHPFHHPSLFRRLVFKLGSPHDKTEAEMSLPTTTAKLRTGDGLWTDSWQVTGLAQHLILARVEGGAEERC